MADIIECNKTYDFWVSNTLHGKIETMKLSLPRHKPIMKSWERLCEHMELYLKHREDDKNG